MTIDQAIEELKKARDKVGGNAKLAVMRADYGENDYIIPSFAVTADLEDQDGRKFKCALIGTNGGEELTKVGVAHHEWKYKKDRV